MLNIKKPNRAIGCSARTLASGIKSAHVNLSRVVDLTSHSRRRYSASPSLSHTAPGQLTLDAEACSAAVYLTGSLPAGMQQFVGPIEGQEIPGSGFGLVATQELQPGDLVLLQPALAVCHGPPDDMPDPGELVAKLRAMHLTPEQEALLRQMYCGLDRELTSRHQGAGDSSSGGGSSGSKGDSETGRRERDGGASSLDVRGGEDMPWLDRLERIVALNAFGDAFEDLGVASVRAERTGKSAGSSSQGGSSSGGGGSSGDGSGGSNGGDGSSGSGGSSSGSGGSSSGGSGSGGSGGGGRSSSGGRMSGSGGSSLASDDGSAVPGPTSHVGLWTAPFAFANHSCLPTCVHYVVGSTMVVRAVRPVLPGQHITISYLGREDYSPASERNRALSERYGFACRCPRCATEGALPQAHRATLLRVHRAARADLQPALLSAVTGCEGDDEGDDGDDGGDGGGGRPQGAAEHVRDEGAVAAVGAGIRRLCAELEAVLAGVVAEARPTTSQAGLHGGARDTPQLPQLPQQQQQQRDLRGSGRDPVPEEGGRLQGAPHGSGLVTVSEEGTRPQGAPHGSGLVTGSEEDERETQQQLQLLYLQSTVYDLFELMYMHAQTTGEDSSLPLALAAAVVAVNPGSELQVWQACKQLAAAMAVQQAASADGRECRGAAQGTSGLVGGPSQSRSEGGAGGLCDGPSRSHSENAGGTGAAGAVPEGVQRAAAGVGEAHFLRYGRLPGPLLRRLVAANTRLCHEYL
ncbi:MAG: hypothetical protein WDW36_003345 [Sanguina aurantia]